MIDKETIRTRFEALSPHLNERARRLFAASEAQAAGRGGVAAVAAATGVARSTIGRGLAELRGEQHASSGRIRRPGGGRELRPKGDPEPVRVHDFKLPELGKVAPYGVYDIAANAGWINLGITSDTAAFAVESIRRWWQEPGQSRYPDADRILITADCGGSNGVRVRLWKTQLQALADQTGLSITVTGTTP
jgi:hypothetical protein